MYLVSVKRSLEGATRGAFGPGFPVSDFAGMHVSLEYPTQKIHYPGIWIDFEPVGNLTRSGIDQMYYAYPGNGPWAAGISLWRAQGYATFTLAALTSLQRDRLYDLFVGMVAFSNQAPFNVWRAALEANPYVACNINADAVSTRGSAERPTEWTDAQWVYETTVAIEMVIEFAASVPTGPLATLESVSIAATAGTFALGATVT